VGARPAVARGVGRDLAAGPLVRIVVRDDGMGIPADMLGRIFDAFIQQPQTSERSRGWPGLGLTVVRSLVEGHDGTAYARSDWPGRGSEFIIELPLLLSGGELVPGPSPTPARSALPARAQPGRILVVDDNEDAAGMLEQMLDLLGYQVAVAYDGPSALDIAPAFDPDVALLDIGLPVMDGPGCA